MKKLNKKVKTKARLLKAVNFLITKGEKLSVSAITKRAKLAYGTFYRYFKDLDEIYLEAIEASLNDLSVKLTQDLANVNPAPLRVYVTWYLVIDFFKDKPKKLVAYWWSLVTLAIFIQIYLLYRVA